MFRVITLSIFTFFFTINASAVSTSKFLETYFLDTEVQIQNSNNRNTIFKLRNNSLVSVRNDIHLRLVNNPFNIKPNEWFRILAPMTAVKTINGDIDNNYIKKYKLRKYIELREKYNEYYPTAKYLMDLLKPILDTLALD